MRKVIQPVTLLIFVIFMGCQAPNGRVQSWSQQMRNMAQNIENLIPFMFDSNKYSDPKNEKFISLYLKNLNISASDLDKHTAKGLSGKDPLFEVGLKGLKTMIAKSRESYEVESYEYSQRLLQASVQYCNACHSRTRMGPTFIKWDKFESITAKLNAIDHANILVATRQFPKAADVLEYSVLEGKSKDSDKELSRLMLVTLKNLNSPARAYKFLNKLPQKKRNAKGIRQWRNYLESWSQGGKKKTLKSVKNSKNVEGQHLVEAIHHGSILHNGLATGLDRATRAKIYYSLGKIYSKYPNISLWNLPENYFEACIRQSPHSKLSRKCYFQLEKNMAGKMKGNANSFLVIENQKLKKLKALASKKSAVAPGSGVGFGVDRD